MNGFWKVCFYVSLLFFCVFIVNTTSLQSQSFSLNDKAWPGWRIELWETVVRYDHPGFAIWSAPLGDINGDGYEDFAIATRLDTTFIFLGGVPFDHEPAFWLYGGSSGIDVGDFNGDGLTDLVTGRSCYRGEAPCPDGYGEVRIYLQKSTHPAFGPVEDRLMQGKRNEGLGSRGIGYGTIVQTLDFNGDEHDDIITRIRDWNDSLDAMAIIFLGGPDMDAEADLEFRAIPRHISDRYANDFMTGDLNGDGCDDVLIRGSSSIDGKKLNYWDLYLGNPEARQDASPHRVISSYAGTGWAPQNRAGIMDVNNDGYDDIIDGGEESIRRPYGDALVFRGSAELPMVILPNDSIPNNEGDRFPWTASPVGDMDGDGINDLLIPWALVTIPGGVGYFYYPGGFYYKTPTGYTGHTPDANVDVGAHPAGDVNGDGYDDILFLGKGVNTSWSEGNRFQIHLGARQLSTSVGSVPKPSRIDLQLSPNPITMEQPVLHLRVDGCVHAPAQLMLTDLLGRRWKTATITTTGQPLQLSWDLTALPAGIYLITAQQNGELTQQKLMKL